MCVMVIPGFDDNFCKDEEHGPFRHAFVCWPRTSCVSASTRSHVATGFLQQLTELLVMDFTNISSIEW